MKKIIFRSVITILCISILVAAAGCSSKIDIEPTSEKLVETQIKETTNNNSQDNSEFEYPNEKDFSVSVNPQKVNFARGENIVIECTITNNTDRDFFTEIGKEVFTYSYNDDSEIIEPIAVISTFKSKSEMTRTLKIEATASGEIVVTVDFRVKPSRYSDTFRTYTYTEKVNVTVE